jgi:hypothetical protein
MRVPQRGDFQSFGLAGAFEPSAAGVLENRSYFGLVPEASYWWGTLKSDDGTPFVWMRRMPFAGTLNPAPPTDGPPKSIGRRATLFTWLDREKREIGVHRGSVATGHNDRMSTVRRGDEVHFTSDPDTKGRPFRVVYHPDRLHYVEQDLIDITGTTLRPGLQWCLPGRDLGMLYCSQAFACEGSVAGVPVSGFFFLEQTYMPQGAVLYAHRDILMGEKSHLTWYSWATEWDDGETEFGHFLVGNDRLGIGIASNQRALTVCSSSVDAVVTPSADAPWSERVDLDVEGERWEILQPAELRILPTSHTENPQQEGLVRRVGERRTPVRWMAWGETVPGQGRRRNHRYEPAYRLIEEESRAGARNG